VSLDAEEAFAQAVEAAARIVERTLGAHSLRDLISRQIRDLSPQAAGHPLLVARIAELERQLAESQKDYRRISRLNRFHMAAVDRRDGLLDDMKAALDRFASATVLPTGEVVGLERWWFEEARAALARARSWKMWKPSLVSPARPIAVRKESET
jgi:hypothetical protein